MKYLLLLVIRCLGYSRELDVYSLEGDSIREFQAEFKGHLRVFCFYSPYAADSKEFVPKYKQAASALKFDEIPVKLAMIDISKPDNKDFSLNHNVIGYPALVYYLAWTDIPHLYLGNKEITPMINAFKGKIYRFNDFSTEEELENYMKTHRKVQGLVLGVFQEFSGENYELFIDFAKHNCDKYQFGRVKGENWAQKYGLDTEGITLLRPSLLLTSYDSPFVSASKFANKSDFEEFIKREIHSNITWLTPDNKDEFLNTGKSLVVFYLNADPKLHTSQIKYYLNRYAENTNKHFNSQKFTFCIADKETFVDDLEAAFLNTEKLLIVVYKDNQKYVLKEGDLMTSDNAFKAAKIAEFLEQYEQGKLTKYVRSETIHNKRTDKGVRYAVGDTFEDDVQKSSKNQLVYIYSKLNKKSVELLNTIEQVAEYFKNDSNFEIVKIDGSLNELPEIYEVLSYPTIYFSSKIRKELPVKYSSYDISRQKLIEFINPAEKKKKTEL